MNDDTEDFDVILSSSSPILLNEFSFNSWPVMQKSHLVKKKDLDSASFDRKHNSINLTEAIKLRWNVCMPLGGDSPDFVRVRKPISEFVKEMGFQLWIDMDEVVEIRDPVTLERFKEWVKYKEVV